MWDFGQVGTASLWKSGPLFSTGQLGGAHGSLSFGCTCGRL
jgi:hypothetical protein